MAEGNGVQRELGAHEARLDNIDKNISDINTKLDPIVSYIAGQAIRDVLNARKRDYWGLVTSGGIAAMIGSVFTYFMSGK